MSEAEWTFSRLCIAAPSEGATLSCFTWDAACKWCGDKSQGEAIRPMAAQRALGNYRDSCSTPGGGG